MAAQDGILFLPPSALIILYVCNGEIKDPIVKTGHFKDPGQPIKIPNPKSQIRDFQNTFGTRKWEMSSCLGMVSDSPDYDL